jgi:dinuclear metal center YbgI/SA1388 family protein
MTNGEIIAEIERFAPTTLQESWDNTGLQVGSRTAECSGVMLCVDVSPTVVDEAVSRGCNLIISHHPLIFKGLKHITGATPAEVSVVKAITGGVSIYSCHTAVDNADGGVSHVMARMLGVNVERALTESGSGVCGTYSAPLTPRQLIDRVKTAFGSPVVRCTHFDDDMAITRVAMCGGAGGSFLDEAVASGAQVYINSDTRYHDFLDYHDRILIIDIGHFESEQCTKDIFYQIITQKFTNFAVYKSQLEINPINYI